MPPCRPEHLLADFERLGWPVTRPPRLLGELAGGLTNRSYLLDAGDTRWVLRMDASESAALGIDRAREHRIHAAAAEAGLAPPIVAADAARGYLLTHYLDGEPGSAGCDEARLAALLAMLAGVRALQCDLEPFDYAAHARNYVTPGSANEPQFASFVSRLRVLQRAGARGVCHHDPSPANVIFVGDRPQLVDWEYAACGLPLFDLAALAVEWPLTADAVASASATDPEQLSLAIDCYRDLCRLWTAR